MAEMFYTRTHCWVREEDNGDVTIGLTDYAQEQMSELNFIEILPDVGEMVGAEDEIATLESADSTNEVYCPVAGLVTAVNDDLADEPELVNQDPFGRGWLVRIKPDDPSDLDELLDADAYEALLPGDDD